MIDALGHPVLRLVRTSIGPVKLGDLRVGRHRRLNPGEVGALFSSSGANPIAMLAHDGEPGRSIERHRGVVCGWCRDGDRARTPMG